MRVQKNVTMWIVLLAGTTLVLAGGCKDKKGAEKKDETAQTDKSTKKVEAPKKEEPNKEEPKAAEPNKEEPKAAEPDKEEPKAAEPDKEEPAAAEPKKEEPAAAEPDEEEPAAAEPDKKAAAALPADTPQTCKDAVACCNDIATKIPQVKQGCTQFANGLGQAARAGALASMASQCGTMMKTFSKMAANIPGGLPASCGTAAAAPDKKLEEPGKPAEPAKPVSGDACNKVVACCDKMAEAMPQMKRGCEQMKKMAAMPAAAAQCPKILEGMVKAFSATNKPLPAECK